MEGFGDGGLWVCLFIRLFVYLLWSVMQLFCCVVIVGEVGVLLLVIVGRSFIDGELGSVVWKMGPGWPGGAWLAPGAPGGEDRSAGMAGLGVVPPGPGKDGASFGDGAKVAPPGPPPDSRLAGGKNCSGRGESGGGVAPGAPGAAPGGAWCRLVGNGRGAGGWDCWGLFPEIGGGCRPLSGSRNPVRAGLRRPQEPLEGAGWWWWWWSPGATWWRGLVARLVALPGLVLVAWCDQVAGPGAGPA